MGFSRQEYWNGLPFHFPGDLPNPGIKPRSPALQADVLTSELPGKPGVYIYTYICCVLGHSVMFDSATLCTVACGLLCPWDFAGKNTGVGCHFLL